MSSKNEQALNDFIGRVNAPEAKTALSFAKLLNSPEDQAFGEKHWGPSEVDADIRKIDDLIFQYTITSVSGPPVNWVKFAATQYPEIDFVLSFFDHDGGCNVYLKATGEEHTLIKEHLTAEEMEKFAMT